MSLVICEGHIKYFNEFSEVLADCRLQAEYLIIQLLINMVEQ